MPGIGYYWQHHPQVEPYSTGDIATTTIIIVTAVIAAVIACYFTWRV